MDNAARKQVMSNRSGYKRALAGDVAYNMMRMWQGAVGVVPEAGLVSPAYVVARPYSEVESRYYAYLFRTAAYMREVDTYSRGIVSDRNRLYWDEFKQMPSSFPPRAEQRAIADYLDRHGALVRRYIRNRRRLIELLNERKQAIITQAVTRGLDPSAPLKPSGIDWLGDIPAHWEVLPLKRLAGFKSGAGFPVTEQGQRDLTLPFFKVSDMNLAGNEKAMVSCNNTVSIESAMRLGATVFPAGTIIFPKVGGAMLTNKRRVTERPCCVDNNLMGCIVKRGNLKFTLLLLQKIDLVTIAKPGPVPAIGEGEVREIKVAFPPASEQHGIVDHVENTTASINQGVANAQHEIYLIREYRERLIADVVTGKLDVRGVSLPDVGEDEAADEEALPDPGEFEDEADEPLPEEAEA